MKFFFSFFFMFVVLFGAPPSLYAATFGAQSFRLENGMDVVVIPNHRAPVVTHMIWVRAGSADGDPGQSGQAHYLEHLMFKGTKKLGAGEFSRIINTLGGTHNAFTSQDYTAYFETVSKEHLPRVMELNADRLSFLSPSEADYKSEKAVVLEERRERTENDPGSLLNEQMVSALFTNHPYMHPVIGWMDEIERYEWENVKAFYDAWYAPNNLILVVSGDTSIDEVKTLAQKHYGGLRKRALPVRMRPHVPPARGEARVFLTHQDVQQPLFQRLTLLPSESKSRGEALALEVFAEIIDGGSSTRLYRDFVVKGRKAVSASFSYDATSLDYGRAVLSIIPADSVSMEEIESFVFTFFSDLVKKGLSEQECKEAILRLQDRAVFARDSVSGPAMIFGAALATGRTVEDVENWADDIGKVTVSDVNKVARLYFDIQHPWVKPSVIGYLLPEKTKKEGTLQ